MLSCKKASFLISESLDRRLNAYERVSLRFHLVICGICRKFQRSMHTLQNEGRTWHEEIDCIQVSEKLSPEAKQKIIDRIREESNR